MSIVRLQGEVERRNGIYYQVDSADEPIGVGGMGQVYKGICVNERTGATRPVAIKFMFDDLPPKGTIVIKSPFYNLIKEIIPQGWPIKIADENK